MKKEMLLFDSTGFSYLIVDPDKFVAALNEQSLIDLYSVNYYFYLYETANRFVKSVKYGYDIPLMENNTYEALKATIEFFRGIKILTEEKIMQLENEVFLLIGQSAFIQPFSIN